jgi:hypothetical protein
MARRRPLPHPHPDQNRAKPAQTSTPDSGSDSGTRITVRDVYSATVDDLASIRSVWTDSPDPLCRLVTAATTIRNGNAAEILLTAWAVLALIPRAALHLASWILTHPLRTLAVSVAVAITYLTA